MSELGNVKQAPAPGQAPTGTETMRTSIFLPPVMPGGDQGPPLPSALSAAPTAYTLWRAFCRVWTRALVAGIVLACLAVAAVYYLMPPKYSVQLLIKVNSAKTPKIRPDAGEDVDFSIFKSFQMELVKSRQVINRALEMQVNGRYVKELPLVRDQGDAVGWLQGIKADQHLKSQELVIVSFTTSDRPDELAVVMNTLGKSLIEENRIF